MKKALLLQILNYITNKATGFIFVNEGDESLNLLTVCLLFFSSFFTGVKFKSKVKYLYSYLHKGKLFEYFYSSIVLVV